MSSYVESDKSLLLELNTNGDEVLFTKTKTFEGDQIILNVHEPWAGDTETGFGANASVFLTKPQIEKIVEWLNQFLTS